MTTARRALGLALAVMLGTACSAEPADRLPAPPAEEPADDHVDVGAATGTSSLDPAPFVAALPFRTDVAAALADIAAGDRPGMLFYADPT